MCRGDHWSPTGHARHTVGAHSICARKGAAACGASGTPPPTATRTVHAAQKTPSARGKKRTFFDSPVRPLVTHRKRPPYRRGAFHMRPQGGSRLRGIGDAAPYSHPHSACGSKNSLCGGKKRTFFQQVAANCTRFFFENFKNATFQELEKMICYIRLCYTD